MKAIFVPIQKMRVSRGFRKVHLNEMPNIAELESNHTFVGKKIHFVAI